MRGAPEYEVTGIIRDIQPPLKYGRDRLKQQFLLLTDTPTPQILPIEVHGSLIETLRQIPLLSRVRVRFALEGQLWHPPQGSPRPIVRLIAIAIIRLHD